MLSDLLQVEPWLIEGRAGQVTFADKGYTSAELGAFVAAEGVALVRPARKDERPRPCARFLKPLRQSSSR